MLQGLDRHFDGEVWLVASDPALLGSMAALFTSWAVPVRCFETEYACINAMATEHDPMPSCVMIDTYQLEMTALEMGAAFRSLAADLPIIFAQGHRVDPMATNCDLSLYLEKPYQPGALSDAVSSLAARAMPRSGSMAGSNPSY